MEFLLDSVSLIDHLNDIPQATAYLDEIEGKAALAKHHDLKLATRNTKDFSPQRHDFVVVPYTLGSER